MFACFFVCLFVLFVCLLVLFCLLQSHTASFPNKIRGITFEPLPSNLILTLFLQGQQFLFRCLGSGLQILICLQILLSLCLFALFVHLCSLRFMSPDNSSRELFLKTCPHLLSFLYVPVSNVPVCLFVCVSLFVWLLGCLLDCSVLKLVIHNQNIYMVYIHICVLCVRTHCVLYVRMYYAAYKQTRKIKQANKQTHQ